MPFATQFIMNDGGEKVKQEVKEISEQTIEIARRVVLEKYIARKSDDYDQRAREIAVRLTNTELDKTQIRGLETLAYMTDKISDITDWLKTRVGRDEKHKRWAKDGIGRDLIATLERLRETAQEVVMEIEKGYPLSRKDPDLVRRVHLRLIREYLKHLAAHFEYEQAQKG